METSLLHLFRRVKHEKCYLGEVAQLLLHFHTVATLTFGVDETCSRPLLKGSHTIFRHFAECVGLGAGAVYRWQARWYSNG